jgi:beta-aspartyl-peptidase (threonine type)
MIPRAAGLALSLILLGGCHTTENSATQRQAWAIVIHGGAGTIARDAPAETRQAYQASLRAALQLGADGLNKGESALDVVEQVLRQLEDDPLFNAGKGAVFTADGQHELDASIMVGNSQACGAVTGIRTVRHPITLARKVMEQSPYVFMMGDGAEAFADTTDVERVDPSYFDTEHRRRSLEEALQKQSRNDVPTSGDDALFSTVGAVALDQHGMLAAATSTGGMTAKRWGRIGDSSVIGAGTWADPRCAISCTGWGEQYIRHGVARDIAAIYEYTGVTLLQAAQTVIHQKLDPDDGGMIGVSAQGDIVMVFNTPGMFRGAANAGGRFQTAIWDVDE